MGCFIPDTFQIQTQFHLQSEGMKRRGPSSKRYSCPFNPNQSMENVKKTYIQLTLDDKQLLTKTLTTHFLFYRLPKTQKNKLIENIQIFECEQGVEIFKRGDNATLFFVIRTGIIEINGKDSSVFDNQQKIILKRGNYFGDLALLYNTNRSASAKSLSKSTFFCVSNELFKKIIQQMAKKNYQLARAFVYKIKIFNYLSKKQKNIIAYNTLFLRYQKNQEIFHEGDDANCLYVVTTGTVQIKISGKPSIEMKAGDSFGQNSFKQKQKRSGTAIATQLTSLLSISRQSLIKCLGSQLQQISFYNILKWSFNSNQFLSQISNLQKQKLINYIELRQYQNQQIIRSQDQKIQQIIIVLQQKINGQGIGTIFNIQQAFLQDSNDLILTTKLVKNGKGYIGVLTFQNFKLVLGHNINKITPIETLHDLSQKRSQCISKLQLSEFTIISILKQNELSKTYCVTDQLKRIYTIKCISKQKIAKKNMQPYLLRERQLLSNLDSPFLLKYYITLQNEFFICFLTSFIQGADFSDVLQQIGLCSKKKTQFFMGCLILILQYLHENNIIHRDLKPQNIIVDADGFLNLANFQVAKILTEETGFRTFTVVGTPHYMAPQIVSVTGYSFASDIWSLGILLFEMLFGYLPFGNQTEDPYLIFKQADTKQIIIPKTYEDSSGKQLILKLLSKNPSNRHIEQFAKIKTMIYFTHFDWDSLQKRKMQTPFKIKTKDGQKNLNFSLLKALNKQKINQNKSQSTIWNQF